MDADLGAPRAVFSGGTASRGDEAEGKIGWLAKASASPIAGMEPETPRGAYFGGRGSGMRAAAAEETSGGEGNDFVPGGTCIGRGSEIGATVVKGASGVEMSDLRRGATYFGGRGVGIGAMVAEEASGAREGNDFVPGGTSLGGGSGIEATAVKYASGGEGSDFRPDMAYSGSGWSRLGATMVREVPEGEGNDFLRASCRRKGAAFRMFSCLSVKIFLSLAQDRHLMKCRSVTKCFKLSEGSKESPDSVEADDTGAARLLGSGIPRSGRSGRIAGRVMGSKGRSSRRNFLSGSTDSVMLGLVASRSPGGPRGVGLLGAGVPRSMVP